MIPEDTSVTVALTVALHAISGVQIMFSLGGAMLYLSPLTSVLRANTLSVAALKADNLRFICFAMFFWSL